MKLIIFDIDGTLVYSDKLDSRSFAETYKKLYAKSIDIDWHNYPAVTDHTIFVTSFLSHSCSAPSRWEFDRFQDHFVELMKQKRKETPHKFKEIPAARDTVHRLLADEKVVVAIATGGWERPARVKLNHVGITTGEMLMSFGDRKPTREDIIEEVIEKAKKKHGDFEKVVYVGDAVWDVHATKNLKMDFVGIGFKDDGKKLKEAGAKTIINDYSDYELFLEALEKAVPPE